MQVGDVVIVHVTGSAVVTTLTIAVLEDATANKQEGNGPIDWHAIRAKKVKSKQSLNIQD